MSEPSRRFPPPWHADPMPGGYAVRDANGQTLVFVYSRDSDAKARQEGANEGRGATDRSQHRAAAGVAREAG
jgi:hypothetical protein